jgi:hypothetical protein
MRDTLPWAYTDYDETTTPPKKIVERKEDKTSALFLATCA